MADESRKYSVNPFAAALMAGGDAISGIYGQRGNTYGNYLDALSKRQMMEAEAIKAQQAQAQQDLVNKMSAQRNALSEVNTMSSLGYKPPMPNAMQTPINGPLAGKIDRKNLLQGNIGMGPITGNIYTPKLAEDAYGKKSQIMFERQKKLIDYQNSLKSSEASPMSGDTAGRYAFADEALRNIPKLKSAMFDDKGGFRQDIATKLMYPWKYPKDKEVQNAKRWIIGIATGRGLIQSGTVVKDNEWGRLMNQIGIDAFTDPAAMNSALDENAQFFTDFKGNIKPGQKGKSATTKPSKDSLGLF